jgi:hypothetical protein
MPGMIRILFLILFTGISINLFPQACLTGKNQYDSGGKKHGYWIEVSKLHPEKIIFKGWYKHGKETKRCTYYNFGLKLMKIKYLNDSLMRVRRYDFLGNLEYKGSAFWITNANEMHYCWDGAFTFYDSQRHKIRKASYKRGVEQNPE